MCSHFLIRKKIARVSPEGLPAIRLIGLQPCDDEKFMRELEHRFSVAGAYKSILKKDFDILTEKEQKSLTRAIAHMKQQFEYRRYSENPSWLDIVPLNRPPGVLKGNVPPQWYKILVDISHTLGYAV